MRAIIKHILLFVVYGSIGTVLVGGSLFIHSLQDRPDLRPWHVAELDEEFDGAEQHRVSSFAQYVQLEEGLFRQLQEQVYHKIDAADQRLLNRYHAGSLADPQTYPHNWNRSFEYPNANPRGGVLLIHGLSDSPYSMRPLAELFRSMGYWVVGLRLPGHGTAPSGLLQVTWEDFAAATELAAQHVRASIGADKPFYIAGYSTGAALAVEYSLAILAGSDNPMPQGLILLSPAIGVSSVAAAAIWQERLSRLPGLEKLAWNSIQPEFDPFKYQSFAVNAGDQIYRLTVRIGQLVSKLDGGGGIEGFPDTLAFQSVVDATVTTPALISGLFDHVTGENHSLVLFDINRHAEAEPLLVTNPEATTTALLKDRSLPFDLTVVTNASPQTNEVLARTNLAYSDEVTEEPLALPWPKLVFSLSHVALPFPPDDPLYGSEPDSSQRGIHLGKINLVGERGLLLFPANEVIRLRYNPFFDYMAQRIRSFVTSSG